MHQFQLIFIHSCYCIHRTVLKLGSIHSKVSTFLKKLQQWGFYNKTKNMTPDSMNDMLPWHVMGCSVHKREENPWSEEPWDRSSLRRGKHPSPGAGHHQALSPTSGPLKVEIVPFCAGSEGCCRVRYQPWASWEQMADWGAPWCLGNACCNALHLGLLPSLCMGRLIPAGFQVPVLGHH